MKNNHSNNKTIKGKTNKYILKENNTIKNIDFLKKDILTAYNKSDHMQIIGKDIKDIDITFIQLMFSIRKSSLKNNKQIDFSIDLPDELMALLEHNGFNSLNVSLNK